MNPMMPMPNTLYSRVADVCDNMLGVKGMHINMEDFVPSDGIVYIDPPYDNTTSYGYSFDVLRWISKCPVPCFVSEAKPLGDAGITMTISNGRKKGGISGDRKSSPNKEWLSIFNSIGAKHENVRTVFG